MTSHQFEDRQELQSIRQQHLESILECCRALEPVGGVCRILFQPETESLAMTLMDMLEERLTAQGYAVIRWTSPTLPTIPEAVWDREVFLVPHIGFRPEVFDILATQRPRRLRMVVAGGYPEDWARWSWEAWPHLDYPLSEVPQVFPSLAGEVPPGPRVFQMQTATPGTLQPPAPPEPLEREEDPAWRLQVYVALFGRWHVPLPLALLARMVGRDEDWTADTVDEIHWLTWEEQEDPPSLFVRPVTLEKTFQRARALGLSDSQILDACRRLLESVDSREPEERYTALRVLQIQRKIWGRRVARELAEQVGTLWDYGDGQEAFAWGRLWESLGDANRAREIYASGLRREPRNVLLLHAQAMLAMRQGRFGEAQTWIRRALRVHRANPFLWHTRGKIALEQGNVRIARQALQRALIYARGDDERIFIWVTMADLAAERGQWDQVRSALAPVLEAVPDHPYALHLQSRAAYYQGAFREAEALIDRLLTLDPARVAALTFRGQMALERGHWGRAEQWLNQALAVDAENVLVLHLRGRLEIERKRWDEADRWLRQALALESDSPQLLVTFANLYRKRGGLEVAHQTLMRVLSEYPENVFALHELGKLHWTAGQWEEAIRVWRKVLRIQPRNLPARISLLQAHLQKQGWPFVRRQLGALRRSVRRIRRVPSRIQGLNALAEVALQARRFRVAEHLIRESAALDPENTYTVTLQARVWEALGRPDKAMALRQRAAELRGP